MQHAFIAQWGNGKPMIGFLAEYDALPHVSQEAGLHEQKELIPSGNGHGCGHNALGAGSALAAASLKHYMEKNNLSGTVLLYGCPAEEFGSGKAYMARLGLFNNLDAALTWHPQNMNSVLAISMLANYGIRFAFKGISSHAAGYPERGRSALDATELMAVGVNYLREHVIQEARMHYAYTDVGGEFPNVVQPTAELRFLLRAPKLEQVDEIFHRVEDIAKGAALMTGTSYKLTWEAATANIIVNDTYSKLMYDNFNALPPVNYSQDDIDFINAFEQGPILTNLLPYKHSDFVAPASSDVGDVSWQTPTTQCTVACYPQNMANHSWQQVSCGKSEPVHKGLVQAAKIMAMTGLDILEKPAIISAARDELAQRLNGTKYNCPIPPEIKPGL
jgi:aminobenzoyl-glutamate utilization protein B